LRKSEVEKLHLVIGDLSLALAEKKTVILMPRRLFRYFDKSQRGEAINKADIVISMLPAHLHIEEIVWFIKEFGNGLVHKRSYARA
jgi:hypothetical protein